MKLRVATAGDVDDLVSLRNATSELLTLQYGKGPWSGRGTEAGAIFGMTRSTVYIARRCKRPLYLTSIAVAPDEQRKGIGRLCIEEAPRIARKWPADAGADEFYRKCGFREAGRATYRYSPLIYLELLL